MSIKLARIEKIGETRDEAETSRILYQTAYNASCSILARHCVAFVDLCLAVHTMVAWLTGTVVPSCAIV